ncbi:hypothetical protein FE257_011791 [Aspergillus nanangensis]|uniref:Uncharacterized protein n=1 Tax=Aspergillus nanangensis TaxID=2582783 RepID=A0AAD4CV98_ASPNN|nr:hypothetical protein FE257_011791 [Aspergillus nanangensis]
MPSIPTNSESDIPDLTGKVIFVTGGTSGLGAQSVKTLAQHNPAHIYFSGRNATKAESLIQHLQENDRTKATTITFIPCDLSSLSSVQSAADKILAQESHLDILICNAGTMAVPAATTADGYEIQFATNHIGHALLIRRLIPLLTSAGSSEPTGRIVILSSMGYKMHPFAGINFPTLSTPQNCWGGPVGPWVRYGQSKLANVVYARELARRYPGLMTVSVHPGVVRTGLVDDLSWGKAAFIYLTTLGNMVTVEKGVRNQVWAATAPAQEMVNGGFYVPVGKLEEVDSKARDKELAGTLWEWTEEVIREYL